jgi:peptidoglycan/LPS O-acetylase OafA/YrhL
VPERHTTLPRALPADSADRSSRLHSLDGLRALAVLLVFAHHVDQGILPGGFVGVDIFFVISGYLITTILLREHESTGQIALVRFYVRRALRLYPALIVTVMAATIGAAAEHIGSPVLDGVAALVYLTDFYANIATHPSLVLHTWSLAVEEQFYLIWPALLIVSLRRQWSLIWITASLAAASVALTAALGSTGHPHIPFIQFLPTSHLVELGSGACLAFATGQDRVVTTKRACGPLLTVSALVLLILAEFMLPADWWAFPAVALICWPPVAHLVLFRESWVSHIFSAPPAVWLGERSYGFYLYHYPVLVLLLRSGMSPVERALLGLAATVVAAALSWRYIERPFLDYKRRFAALPRSGRTPTDARGSVRPAKRSRDPEEAATHHARR